MPLLLRFHDPDLGPRLGVRLDGTIHDVTNVYPSLAAWLRQSTGKPQTAIDELLLLARRSRRVFVAAAIDAPPLPSLPALLPPVDTQDVWAVGIIDAHSGNASERPHLFFKAQARHVVGPYGLLGLRSDSVAPVPEVGLALLLNPALEVVGCGIGIDMTARDLEAESPLYLPQAKIFPAACGLGPGFLLGKLRALPAVDIHLSIERNNTTLYDGSLSSAAIGHTLPNLIDYLGRCGSFDDGVILLTGSGSVPPLTCALDSGDTVRVTIDTIGTLTMTAAQV